MTLFVLGASGQIGHFLRSRLDDAGLPWLALSRTPPPDDARWRVGSLPATVPALPPLQAVISLGPLDQFAAWLAGVRLPGIPHVVAISSMSAETKRDSSVPEEREVSKRLRSAETTVIATCASRGMPWTLFRPTLIYGAGRDKSLTPLVEAALRRRIFPLPAGRGQRQPVHADDIAAAVMASLTTVAARGRTFPLGGGQRMTSAAMFRLARRSAGRPTFPLPIPRFALDVATLVAPRLKGPVQRLDSDLIADNADIEAILGIHPRPFLPQPATWRTLD